MSLPDQRGQNALSAAKQALACRVVAELFVAAAIAAWWITSARLPAKIFPSPVRVFWELVRLSTDPEFLTLIQSSRARHALEGGLSSDEMRRNLEGKGASPRRRSKRPH